MPLIFFILISPSLLISITIIIILNVIAPTHPFPIIPPLTNPTTTLHLTQQQPSSPNNSDRLKKIIQQSPQSHDRYAQYGIHTQRNPTPTFPQTLHTITDAAVSCITHALYAKQRLDPNIVKNAMSRSILDYRPVIYGPQQHRNKLVNTIGRVGVEIDGVRYLMTSQSDEQDEEREEAVMRKCAILMADKLSRHPWDGLEDDDVEATRSTSHPRPIYLYFNSLRQTLQATNDMKHLLLHDNSSIEIRSLSQHPLPPPRSLKKNLKKKPPRRSHRLSQGIVDPTKGLVLIVRPRRSYLELSALQRLATQAAIAEYPTILLSPRMITMDDSAAPTTIGEESSLYGGWEPPRGSPWLLRDYVPPVYTWVMSGGGERGSGGVVGLTNSVMDEGHPWHVFEKKRRRDIDRDGKWGYVASARTGSGRLSMAVVKDILEREQSS